MGRVRHHRERQAVPRERIGEFKCGDVVMVIGGRVRYVVIGLTGDGGMVILPDEAWLYAENAVAEWSETIAPIKCSIYVKVGHRDTRPWEGGDGR